MKKMLVLSALATLGLGTLPAQSAEVSFATHVDKFISRNSGIVDMTFVDNYTGCSNTLTPKQYRMQAGQGSATDSGVKQMLSSLIYAASFNKDVRVYFDDATANCHITKVIVDETSG